jgi:hypothetical protein
MKTAKRNLAIPFTTASKRIKYLGINQEGGRLIY